MKLIIDIPKDLYDMTRTPNNVNYIMRMAGFICSAIAEGTPLDDVKAEIIDIPDTATNEDVMNETLRRVFPKTIFIRSQSIANKTQAINMSDEWLGRNYKEMYK